VEAETVAAQYADETSSAEASFGNKLEPNPANAETANPVPEEPAGFQDALDADGFGLRLPLVPTFVRGSIAFS
jgi:hypothetical protein